MYSDQMSNLTVVEKILHELRSSSLVHEQRMNDHNSHEIVGVISLVKLDGVWFTSLDYKNAQPDPLREFAENLLVEINTNTMKDITRFCNVFVDLNFQDSEAKMIWVDRLGLDMRLFSPNYGLF
ncbi:glutamyl-tRNA reductase-binding protein [Medicago truncatula]|uniref:Glutamyl-tRNA reductase-binding protein n=1 Tax=Medicago truncatula TaxID=3880 RepID=G7JVJ2_MEDTR|nr:glutamyl-tRNA reductase-binding protein [Medicago truncatula]